MLGLNGEVSSDIIINLIDKLSKDDINAKDKGNKTIVDYFLKRRSNSKGILDKLIAKGVDVRS